MSRLRPTPGVVLAAIAVFFAIGGIGYAAAKIGTSDIKNGAVTNKKIKKHTIKKSRLGFSIHNGATGPRGATGAVGAVGGTGPAGGVNYNARPAADGSISRSLGAFTLTTNVNGARQCAATTLSSTADAHWSFGANPYVIPLNSGNNHTSQLSPGQFATNLSSTTDNASSEMMGLSIGCINFNGAGNTFGVLFGG